jgi:hypothetical protein
MIMSANILRKLCVFIGVMLFPGTVLAHTNLEKTGMLKQALGIPLPFIKNVGQINNKDIRFYAKTFGGTVFVEDRGSLTYQLPAKDKQGVVIREIFTGEAIKITASGPLPARINYFKGRDRRNWKTNIPSYEQVSLGEIYRGVTLTLKAGGYNVEKLFTVLPAGNPREIRVRITGGKGLQVNEKGGLEVTTALGPVRFTRPSAFQEINGQKRPVEVAYVLYKGNTYGFEVGGYDKNRPLIIDPLLASTFIGGGNADHGKSIALDASGNVYVTGYTGSADYPTTPGAYDTIHASLSIGRGDFDVFVSKFDADLTTLLASTFIGGGNYDWAHAIALDGSGNVYITGETSSADYPTKTGAYNENHSGSYDVFVSKLNSDLNNLLASTFIGGTGYGSGNSLAIDGSGEVYVVGHTSSSDYPTKPGAYDTEHNGSYDVFVSRLNSDLSSLLSSTLIGGASEDVGLSIALDGSGGVYVTGKTYSPDYPTTSGAYQKAHTDNNDSEVFVSRLNSDLSALSASTFIGGEFDDSGNSIALDASGNVYVAGETASANYPTTPCNAYDATHNGGYDVFVSKLNSGLDTLLASTFIGGTKTSTGEPGWDRGYSIGIDASGNVYVTGETNSSDYPTLSDAYTTHNGDYDVFVSKLDSSLNYLVKSINIGGNDGERGNSLVIDDGAGKIYVTGETTSDDFPIISGAYSAHKGDYDVFVSALDDRLYNTVNADPVILPVARAGSDQTVDEGTVVTLDGSASEGCDGKGISTYVWTQTSGSYVGQLGSGSTITFTAPDINVSQETLTFQLTVTDEGGETDTDTVNITVNWIIPPPPAGDSGGGCFIWTTVSEH